VLDNRSETAAPPVQARPEAQTIRIAGHIKWFEPSKGYGFILPDDPDLGDVLLHMRCVQRGGFAAVPEGARIDCLAQRGRRGLQTISILSIDMSVCSGTVVRAASGFSGDGPFVVARVKWFDHSKGFGFLTAGDGMKDIFLHIEVLKKFGVFEVRPGLKMLVRTADSGKGPIAVEIQVEEPVI